MGEVDEVKREKDIFFSALASRARRRPTELGIEPEVELRAGHAAEVIYDFAAQGGFDLVCSATAVTFCAITSSARLPTASPRMRPAPS